MKVCLSAIATVVLIITLSAQTPQTKAFTGARVIDGTTGAPIDNATIVVRDGRIVAIGPAPRVTIPAGANRTVLAGKTIVPGLINTHGHVGDTEGLDADRYSAGNVMRDLRTYAAYGVTSVVSLGGDRQPSFAARDSQRTSALDRRAIWVAGPVLEPSSPADARKLVADDAALKVDIVKIRVDDTLGTTKKMAPEIYRAVIDEAHKRGLRVAVHVFYLADAKGVMDAGADFIAHSIRDAEVDAPLIAALKARGVCVSPTLMREVSTFVYETTPPFFSDPLFLAHADKAAVAALRQPASQAEMRASPSAQRYKTALEVASRNLKKLSDAGVTIAMGTDTGPPGAVSGLLRADGARADGQGRPHAPAGPRGRDARRGALHEDRQRGRHAPDRQVGRLRRADRGSAGRYHQHEKDRLGVDCGEQSEPVGHDSW